MSTSTKIKLGLLVGMAAWTILLLAENTGTFKGLVCIPLLMIIGVGIGEIFVRYDNDLDELELDEEFFKSAIHIKPNEDVLAAIDKRRGKTK